MDDSQYYGLKLTIYIATAFVCGALGKPGFSVAALVMATLMVLLSAIS